MHLHERFQLRSYLGLSLLGLGCGLAGALSGAGIASTLSRPTVATSIPMLDLATASEPVGITSTARVHTEAAPAPSNQLGFITTVGGAEWFVLDVPAAELRHGKPTLVTDEYVSATIAPLRDRDLTPALRAWRGVAVTVDGACTETVHDFAVLTQVTGDPSYAEETDTRDWTLATVASHGEPVVAAKLVHCTHGTYARAASAPAVVPFAVTAETDADALAATNLAKTTLLASDLAHDVKAEFLAQQGAEPPTGDAFASVTQVDTRTARDPRTNTLWIAVHAHADFACGGPEINFYGLYRVAGTELVTIAQTKTDNLTELTALVDVDGDGVPELLGSGFISPVRAFYTADLTELARYEVPFFGCPC